MIDVTAQQISRTGWPAPADLDGRILRAARDCVAARLRSTTLEDIADAAGCGRASIYRRFPGGRHGLMRAVVANEVITLLAEIGHGIDGADDVSDAVSGAVHTAAVRLGRHAALQRLLAHEPGEVMPYISFDGAAPLLAMVASWGSVHLARFLPTDDAEVVAEWAARLVLSHLQEPDDLDTLTDLHRVRHLVDTYLVPGLRVGVPV